MKREYKYEKNLISLLKNTIYFAVYIDRDDLEIFYDEYVDENSITTYKDPAVCCIAYGIGKHGRFGYTGQTLEDILAAADEAMEEWESNGE